MSDISKISECITQPPYHCCGFILAGGMSSRMGTDKAHIRVGQQSLLEIAKSLLATASVNQSYVIGGDQADIVETQPGMGPANAIIDILRYLNYAEMEQSVALFLPVDMPCLTANTLNHLVSEAQHLKHTVYYNDQYLPLAVSLNGWTDKLMADPVDLNRGMSVRFLLKQLKAKPVLYTGNAKEMLNVNKPEDLININGKSTQNLK